MPLQTTVSHCAPVSLLKACIPVAQWKVWASTSLEFKSETYIMYHQAWILVRAKKVCSRVTYPVSPIFMESWILIKYSSPTCTCCEMRWNCGGKLVRLTRADATVVSLKWRMGQVLLPILRFKNSAGVFGHENSPNHCRGSLSEWNDSHQILKGDLLTEIAQSLLGWAFLWIERLGKKKPRKKLNLVIGLAGVTDTWLCVGGTYKRETN